MKAIMMMLVCSILIVRSGTCYASCNTAICDPGIYLKGFGGLNVAHESRWRHANYRTSAGYAVGAALGYKFSLLSIEGEFSYRHNCIDRFDMEALDIHVRGELRQWCGLGNIILSVPVSYRLAPYIGIGAGYRHTKPGLDFDEEPGISLHDFVESAHEWGVYQAIAGLNLIASRFVHLQMEYRHLNGWSNVRCSNNTLDLSMVIRF